MEVDMSITSFRMSLGRASCLQYELQEGNQSSAFNKEEDVTIVTKSSQQTANSLTDSISFVLDSRGGITIETLDGR